MLEGGFVDGGNGCEHGTARPFVNKMQERAEDGGEGERGELEEK